MRGKYRFLFLTLILSLIISPVLMNLVTASPGATVSVLPDRIEEVPPGEMFGVDIWVADATDLFGFEFKLKYDPDVLTANEVTIGDFLLPKYQEFHKEINDTVGYVWYGVTQDVGEVGVSGSGSLALISFIVDPSGGSCQLSLSDTSKHGELYQNDVMLIDSTGQPILDFNVIDGYFCSSDYYVHDIAITSIAPNATEVISGKTVEVNVIARNEGYFTESFTVTAYAGAIEIGTQPVTNLASGSRAELTFTWDTTGVTLGEYIISATAPLSGDADPTDNTYTMAYDFVIKNYVDVTITVMDYPVARFTYSSTYPCLIVNIPVTFNASDSTPDGGTISYLWDFGDNKTGSVYKVTTHIYTPDKTHNYTKGYETYNVTLTVTDSEIFKGEHLTDIAWKVITVLPEGLHDVAVINVETSAAEVILGESVNINVVVKNNGSATETFDVTAYAETIAIETKTVTDLPPYNNQTLTFTWSTTGVDPGTYTIKAVATLTNDNDTTNNERTDGTITILAPPIAQFTYWPPDGYAVVDKPVTFDAIGPDPLNPLSYDPDGDIVSYSWDFGDGNTGSGETTTHTYTTTGQKIITLRVVDDDGIESAPTQRTMTVVNKRDIEVTSVTPSPTKLRQGLKVTINATISNIGEAPETFTVTAYYNQTLTQWIKIGEKSVTSLLQPLTSTTLTFYWDTSGVTTERYYQILVNATEVYHETNVTNNAKLSDSLVYIKTPPSFGLDLIMDVGVIHFGGETAEFYILTLRAGQRVNVNITATLYFSGTIKEEFAGDEIQPIETGLYLIRYNIPVNIESGTYTLHVEANYFDSQFADFLLGNTLKSFLISQTLTGWNPMLISIDGTVGTIKNDVDLIKLNLKDINATLTEIIKTAKGDILAYIDTALGPITANLDTINATLTDIIVDSKGEILAEISYYLGTNGTITVELEDIGATLIEIIVDSRGHILAKIDSAIGPVTTTLDAINAKVVAIDGNVATIKTDVDTVKTTLSTVQTTSTTPLYVTSVFSVVAAIIALIVLFILRRKPT